MIPRTLLCPILLLAVLLASATAQTPAPRPNILWLVNEDHGPHVGCYGDPNATTPTFDALAARGLRYTFCWSNAPVCAPARTTLISGLYAHSSGGEHMRSMVPMPKGKQMYPQLLRGSGYYCTNNAKEDYNVSSPEKIWDESSKKAHWKNRPDGQPFMAVFNSEKSHESQIRKRPHQLIHDPAKVRVPAYHPDTPEVRHDWAQYYDGVSAADADAGARLKELEAAGLAEDTIVFYFSDHGSGMPFNKRWPYDRGLHVPLIIYIPEKFAALRPADYRAGETTDRLVSFVDFAPTLCSLAGVKPPEYLQGQAFLGPYAEKPQSFLFGFRGRMDERPDSVRSVTDGRYVYVRQFRPDRIYGQHVSYQWETPTTVVWQRLFREGNLTPEQASYWRPKPEEELYDLRTDRDEVRNLAAAPEQRETLEKLRAALKENELRIRDVGLLPEGEMHRRMAGESPYDMARTDGKLDFAKLYEAASVGARRASADLPALRTALQNADPAIRYWAALGLLVRGEDAVKHAHAELRKLLSSEGGEAARTVAAEALAHYGSEAERAEALRVLQAQADWAKNDLFIASTALDALSVLGDQVAPLAPFFKSLPSTGTFPHTRYRENVSRILTELRQRFP